jgi:NADH-quinone oxidoreductase subunit N
VPVLFQLSDIPRLLPEILLLALALLVLGSDVFERWASDEEAQRERIAASGSLAAIGLGLIFVIALLQSGYIYRMEPIAADASSNFFATMLRNLQAGGPQGQDALLGAFATGHLTMIGRLIFIFAAFLTVLLTLDHRPDNNPGEFYALILFSTVGMCLMAGASELILAYLAVELTSIPLYILAGYFQKDTKISTEAGMKYFLFGALSSGIMLYGMSLVYGIVVSTVPESGLTNTLTQFSTIAQVAGNNESFLLMLGIIFLIAGLGYKVALVPFHSWSPDVYQGAMTPITAFISTASKAAGFLLLFRVLTEAFPGFVGSATLETFGGWTSVLAVLALATVIIGNLAALPQQNAKRLLAYSSVAHAGFVVLALIAWASPLTMDRSIGVSSLLYYLVVYTVTNMGAFGALAVVSQSVGGDDIDDLNGLAQRNLGLAVLLTISVLSLAGIPPLSGFLAKFYVFMAAWQGGAWWLVITSIITTLISLYYYLRLLRAMFITGPEEPTPIKTPRTMNAVLVVAVALILLLGIYPNVVLTTIGQVQVATGM